LTTDIPVTVIGGYLGAGKTTVVNHLLRHAAGRRIAILVNEFGDLPIDQDLIEAEGEDMIAISGGCICCSFGSDLTAALIKLSELTPTPDHVVIEASGGGDAGHCRTQHFDIAGICFERGRGLGRW
jgi:G3E family GTPase